METILPFGDNGHRRDPTKAVIILVMEVERIYANELDSEPEIIARKQRKLETRLSSHDELISDLLNKFETVQGELTNLNATVARRATFGIREYRGPQSRKELRLWTLFRQRLKTRLERHLRSLPSGQA